MSSTVQILLKDDLDGSPADQTIVFTFDSITYEIDLSQRNVIALRQALSKYIKAARPVRATSSDSRVTGNGRTPAKSAVQGGRSTSSRKTSRGPVRGKSSASNRPSARVRSASGAGANPAAVREWARRQGIAVSQRGRISADVVAKFQGARKIAA